MTTIAVYCTTGNVYQHPHCRSAAVHDLLTITYDADNGPLAGCVAAQYPLIGVERWTQTDDKQVGE